MLRTLLLLALAACALLFSGCVTRVDPDLPVDELVTLTTASDMLTTASASDPAATLPVAELPQGSDVQLLGADDTGAWLLVFDGDFVGWMPVFMSATPTARESPPLIIQPLDGSCTRYLGATFAPDEEWTSPADDPVIVQGSIYRPESTSDFVGATLTVQIDGSGAASAAEYVHVPLTRDISLVLFAFALDKLDQGSVVTFGFDDPSDEPVIFQSAFFTDKCGSDWTDADARFTAELPVGETSLYLPEPPEPRKPPAGQGSGTRPRETTTPTPKETTISVESEDRRAPTRREIQTLLDEWDRIHHEADYSLGDSDLPLVLTGGALRQQQDTLDALARRKCYWEFTTLEPTLILEWDQISVNEVIVTVNKHWDGDLYCKGHYQSKESFDEPFDVRYQIIRTSDGWRIAEKVPLD